MLATMAHKDWLRISSDKTARGGRVGPTQGKAGPLAADKLCKPFSNLGKLETWSIPASPPVAAMGSSGLVMDSPRISEATPRVYVPSPRIICLAMARNTQTIS